MKKLLVVAVVGVMAYGGWRWQHEPEPAQHPHILFNRFWVDHMPQGEKDTVKVFALWQPESFGVFADQNHWRVELERFRYEASGDKVQAIFPLSGARETITATATRCTGEPRRVPERQVEVKGEGRARGKPSSIDDWDFCLELTGSSHGTKRYYSRLGWERKDRSVEQFVDGLR